MESEKVKEIKKALENNANYEHYDKLGYIDGYKCKTAAYADILTYINELESENERLSKELDSEWKDRRKAEENLHRTQWNYKIGLGQSRKRNKELKDLINELESENELLRNAKVVYETVDYCYEDLKKAENRIAELEKENDEKYKRIMELEEDLAHADENVFYRECNIALNEKEIKAEALKQFAERLIEKFDEQKYFYETASISHRDISLTALNTAYRCLDEILKEYEK